MKEKCNGQSGERKLESGGVNAEARDKIVDRNTLGLIRVGDCPPGVELEHRQFNTDPNGVKLVANACG